ncbi:MAG: thiamine pyrophosphate-binding protein [Sterolibacterium sp.]|jgi:acetolactate synthase-1/2/3 large subunit
MRVADYIAEFIHKQGVRNVFLLSGTGSIHLDDAFAFQSGMKYITARHEGAAVVMAEAAAKLSDGIGVVVTTTGPGGTNAFSGIVEAWVDSTPVFVISGQVSAREIVPELRSFGIQGFNIIDQVQRITKYAVLVTDPLSIRFHLEKALHLALTGRRGPVWLDIPSDVQAQEIDRDSLEGYIPNPAPAGDSDWKTLLDSAIESLMSAKRPLIVVGQGVRQANAIPEFQKIVDLLGIPVVSSRLGQDILPDDHPLYFNQGGLMGHRHTFGMMTNCDLVLSFGSSLSQAFTGNNASYFSPDTQFIMVDIDPSEIGKLGNRVKHSIVHDVKEVFQYLAVQTAGRDLPRWADWVVRCKRHKTSRPVILPTDRKDPINSYCFLERLDAASDSHHIFVSDAGGTYYIAGQGLKFNRGQREVTSGAFASMGMTLPLAIGAAATVPDAQILALTGDGSIELNIQELRTISQYDLNIKVFVINNGGYASIRASQDASCGGRYTDEQKVLNFKKVADAFELPFHMLEHFDTLDTDIPLVLAMPGPALIEVVCDSKQKMVKFEREDMPL